MYSHNCHLIMMEKETGVTALTSFFFFSHLFQYDHFLLFFLFSLLLLSHLFSFLLFLSLKPYPSFISFDTSLFSLSPFPFSILTTSSLICTFPPTPVTMPYFSALLIWVHLHPSSISSPLSSSEITLHFVMSFPLRTTSLPLSFGICYYGS